MNQRDFADEAEKIDAERARVLEAILASGAENGSAGPTATAGPPANRSGLMEALLSLNDRCDELRALFFPQARALSIANGRATTWSASGLMRTVWAKRS